VIETRSGRVVGMLAMASIVDVQRDCYAIPPEWLRSVWTERTTPSRLVRLRESIRAVWRSAGRIRRPGFRRPFDPLVRHWKIAVAVLAVAVTAGLLLIPSGAPGGAAACRPPVELRVLASPEGYSAMTAAAEDYADGQRGAGECRQVHLTVYQAGTDAVLRGFAQADGWAAPAAQPASTGNPDPSCPAPRDEQAGPAPDPARDVGPRPDVWFPDSIVDVERARRCVAPGAVRIGNPTPIAWSPLILGVPQSRRGSFPATQPQDWPDLRQGLANGGLDLVRPNPESSTAGLVHTVNLYQALRPAEPDGAARDLERGLATGSIPLSDSVDLLCHLASVSYPPPGPAVLVSEATMVTYNLRTSDLPNCPAKTPGLKFDALYPKDGHDQTRIPALDHPFVDLTWTRESNAQSDPARADAVRLFRDWLLSDGSQRKLTTFALRPVQNVPFDPDSPLLNRLSGAQRDVPQPAASPAGDAVSQTLRSYTSAREAGRVVFLVDVSWSMSANGNLAAAKGIVESALGLMRAQDDAGLTTVPKDTGNSAELNILVTPGAQSSAGKVREALGGVVPVHNGTALYDAIDRQLSAMAADPGPAKQTLVVIADGEDVDGGKQLSVQTIEGLTRHRAGPQVSVQVVALPPATCGTPDLNRVANELGGRCVSTVDNRTGASLVAGVW
jgi:Mg-chelatase subunit ChlD